MLRFCITLYICREQLSLPIVITLDFSRALSLLIAIALSLQASVIAYFIIALRNTCKRYCFQGSNGVILAITLPSSLLIPLPYCREKRDNSIKSYNFYCEIFKRALLFLCFALTWKSYRFIILLLCIVIAVATCVPVIAFNCYRYRKIGNVIASLSYCFCNIRTVIAFINYSSGNIRIVCYHEIVSKEINA